VFAQDPEIAAAGDRWPGGRRQAVLGLRFLLADVGGDKVDLAKFKASDRNLEIGERQLDREVLELAR
jgi:hypothetical protein